MASMHYTIVLYRSKYVGLICFEKWYYIETKVRYIYIIRICYVKLKHFIFTRKNCYYN